MVELLREQWDFILYNDNGSLILNVLCGSVGIYEVSYILDKEEARIYNERGLDYLKELVKIIRDEPSKVPASKLRAT